MKKTYILAGLILFIGCLAKPVTAVAQSEEDIAAFLEANEEDASKLIGAYLQPMIRSMSYGMAGGWYTTAKAHSTLGFDLSFTLNAAFIPDAENFFDPNKLGLSSATVYDGAIPVGSPPATTYNPLLKAPTFFGPKDKTQYTSTYDPDGSGPLGSQSYTMTGPEGLDMKEEFGVAAMPTPMIQLGIGVIKNTDIKIRFIPKQEVKSSEISMFGVGIMHDIKQHIKGIKLLPFDLSALVAYNSVTGSTDLKNTGVDSSPDSPNGEGVYKFNSWVFQALVSKKISVLTGYAGLGYSFVDTAVGVNGDFIIDPTPAAPASGDEVVSRNPVDIDFKNKSMRMTLGLRLKLGPVFFVGDYTFQKYNTLSVGFGVSVR